MKKHIAGKIFSEYRRESAFPENSSGKIISTEIFRNADTSPLSPSITQEK